MDGRKAEAFGGFAWAREQERLLWAVRVRWAVAAGFSLVVLALHPLGLFADLGALVAAGAVGLLTNGVNHLSVRRGRAVVAATIFAVLMDNVLITYACARSGGFHSPLVLMYSIQVVATAMLVTTPAALLSAAWAACCAAVLIGLDDGGAALLFTPEIAASPPRAARLGAVAWGLSLAYGSSLLIFVGGFVSGRLRRREGELAEQNRRLAASVASLAAARDEVARAYERLQQAEAHLVQSEKMRALGQVVAGVAHELNNPISFVASNIEPLRQYFERLLALLGWCAGFCPAAEWGLRHAALEPVLRDLPVVLDDCAEGARRAKRIVSELRTFSHAGAAGAHEEFDVNDCVRRTLRILRHHFGEGRSLELDLGAVPAMRGRPDEVEQVLLNLVVNAVEASAAGAVRVRSRHDPAAGLVRIAVSDDGTGIAPEHLAKVFEPFFTTKPVGQGTGIGLSLSYAIVKRHGGELTVASQPGRGATFEVALPIFRND